MRPAITQQAAENPLTLSALRIPTRAVARNSESLPKGLIWFDRLTTSGLHDSFVGPAARQ